MVGKLRLGRRLAVGAAVIFGVLFAVVGQGAHRAAAIGLDASVVSISGSPEVPEGSTAQFTATISPVATGDFDVDYTASAGGVSGSFHVTAGDATEQVNVATQIDSTSPPNSGRSPSRLPTRTIRMAPPSTKLPRPERWTTSTSRRRRSSRSATRTPPSPKAAPPPSRCRSHRPQASRSTSRARRAQAESAARST